MRAAARMIAQAIQQAPKKHAAHKTPASLRGTIVKWNGEADFTIDPHGSDLPNLDQDDVTLGQSVRRHHRDVGLKVGDVLALIALDEDDFLAVEVEGDGSVAWEGNFRDSLGGPITRSGGGT